MKIHKVRLIVGLCILIPLAIALTPIACVIWGLRWIYGCMGIAWAEMNK